ncbi:MAG TPA: hypothetical protein VFZ53_24300 [Polyangiaceae bacterium]
MKLRAEWARRNLSLPLFGVALAAACSLQDFEYLQVPADGPPEGGTSGTGGQGGQGGVSGSSGTPGTGGRGGSSGTSGGSSGASGSAGSGTGGRGGSAGTAGEGGGEGGGDTGGSSTGGTAGKGGTAGTGAVGELVNPSFETNTTTGWTVSPPEALTNRWIYTQAPTGSVPAPHGAYELATWHNMTGYQVEIFQNVTGLEDGTYTFSGFFSWGLTINEIYLFARNCSDTDPEPMPIPTTPADSFVVVSMEGIEVVGGSCEVGLYVDGSVNSWMNADNFAFEPE